MIGKRVVMTEEFKGEKGKILDDKILDARYFGLCLLRKFLIETDNGLLDWYTKEDFKVICDD